MLVASIVGGGGDDDDDAAPDDLQNADPGDCIVVDMAVSSEKIALLADARRRVQRQRRRGRRPLRLRPPAQRGVRATPPTLIPEGWPNPEVNGEPPVIWSPAASAWAGIVNERAGTELAPAGTPFMLTPLVIAMPRADGRGARLAGGADRLRRPR